MTETAPLGSVEPRAERARGRRRGRALCLARDAGTPGAAHRGAGAVRRRHARAVGRRTRWASSRCAARGCRAAYYPGDEAPDRWTADGWFRTGDIVTIGRDRVPHDQGPREGPRQVGRRVDQHGGARVAAPRAPRAWPRPWWSPCRTRGGASGRWPSSCRSRVARRPSRSCARTSGDHVREVVAARRAWCTSSRMPRTGTGKYQKHVVRAPTRISTRGSKRAPRRPRSNGPDAPESPWGGTSVPPAPPSPLQSRRSVRMSASISSEIHRLGHVVVEPGREGARAVLGAPVAGERDERTSPQARHRAQARAPARSRPSRAGRCRAARRRDGTPRAAVERAPGRRARSHLVAARGSSSSARLSAASTLSSTTSTRAPRRGPPAALGAAPARHARRAHRRRQAHDERAARARGRRSRRRRVPPCMLDEAAARA